VLDGTFQDEDGDFPTGSYVRNPPTSSHIPAARDGATILVKLHQFDPDDRRQVQIDSGAAAWSETAPGVETLLLHEDARERVVMEHWAPGTVRALDASGGSCQRNSACGWSVHPLPCPHGKTRPFQVLQNQPGNHPLGGDAVRPVPAVAPQRRRSAPRTWHRCHP